MQLILIVGGLLAFCFGFVLLYGAPYLPTLSKQVETALDLVDLQPGDTLLELGCGDGKILIAAAARGWNVVGYELNPLLALIAWLRTRRYHKQVRIVCGNFWSREWPEAQGIFVFLLDKYMVRLDTKIAQLPTRPIKLVSFAFQIPNKTPATSRSGVYLYEYK
ncbi:MAG TPA: class I SAM-dependent methyltransferase [Candidatus Saccharimonadales bacterium]|jgi:16S rRNA A1518/A1519 N6-dimethyltransferase RsmA/KsgA/DIM1 with predicted DNA glycosylase/AP lyase activity